MVSELNGQENYFTRICVGGLLNTRKLELAHMLLQDINMFHLHPNIMPDSNLDNCRLISSAISNMELNDRRIKSNLKIIESHSNLAKLSNLTSSSTNLTKSSTNLVSLNNSYSPQPSAKLNSSKTDANINQSASTDEKPNANIPNELNIKEEIETSINDLASFILYASRKPSKAYQPIKEQHSISPTPASNPSDVRMKHNISYIPLDDNPKLDYHTLQALQNGFTFTCILNELDMMQSNFLLNIRLESDNSTLIWSRPAWDITNAWANTPGVNTTSSSINNISAPSQNINSSTVKDSTSNDKNLANSSVMSTTSEVASNMYNRRQSQVKLSLMNSPLLMSYENSSVSFKARKNNFITSFHSTKRKMNKNIPNRRKFTMPIITQNTVYQAEPAKPEEAQPTRSTNKSVKIKPNRIISKSYDIANEIMGGARSNKSNLVNSSSFEDNQDLVFDKVDPNLVYSVSSLTKHYVFRESVSVNDPYEGFIDLNSVKHIRIGCLDSQVFNVMQQIAIKYAIPNFDHSNIICLVYGTTFSENR